ncbi:hypothetical protein CA54_46890 [Symmachiella macrocystis]|uniref:Transporter suffix domain-containing protein n=1 Tax=Symmachiella macrocystis TaxID=2527985 RepID=A0A5C6BCW7_9PLAN|nr:transporter suffix domain-containing protein [Symmachiella macrocystis]TWU09447.1 hypothetical protein CA54_46890 [Symmachiella macrocystis]
MSDERSQAGWRTKVGFAIFVVSIGWPVLIPLLVLLGVSATTTAVFSGIMVVAAEFLLIAAAAVAGKEGLAFIKAMVFGFFKSYGPPSEVSRTRYTIGLVMFMTPLAFGWASPYLAHYFPGLAAGQLVYSFSFDVLLLISLFVLGSGFWDKLRSLFQHNAYVVIPEKPSAESTPQ